MQWVIRVLYYLGLFVTVGVIISLLLSFIPDGSFRAAGINWARRFATNLETFLLLRYEADASGYFSTREILINRTAISLLLILGAIMTVVLFGGALGIVTSIYQDSGLLRWLDRCVQLLSSMPVIIWLIVIVSVTFGLWKYTPDFTDPRESVLTNFLKVGGLGIFCLMMGDRLLGEFVSSVQNSIASEFGKPYITAIKSRGEPIVGHLLRGITPKLAGFIANKISYLLAGTVVIEFVFKLQGLGWEIYHAITGEPRNYALILAASMVFTSFILFTRFVADGMSWIADPRLRESH